MQAYWSIRHTARYLGLSTKAVYRLIEKGDLEAVRFSARSTRVLADSVANLIERRRTERRQE